MKKLFTIIAMLTVTMLAHAQFEAEKVYIGSSITGLNMNYNGGQKFNFGFNADGGYFVDDNWLIKGTVGFSNRQIEEYSAVNNVLVVEKERRSAFEVGVGARYYIQQNGIFLGLGAKLHLESGNTDVMPGVELGYAFFINDKVAIEPALYYDQSIDDHKNKSTVGLKVGLGLFF